MNKFPVKSRYIDKFLAIPKENRPKIQIFHIKTSKKKIYKGQTVCRIFISDDEIIEYKTRVNKKMGDVPNKKIGLQVAIGKALKMYFKYCKVEETQETENARTSLV